MAPVGTEAASEASDPKVQTLDDFDNSDFTAARNEYHFRTPVLTTVLEPYLKDPRDVPMICLMLNIVFILGSSACGVFAVNMLTDWSPSVRHLCGLAHVVLIMALFMERFILMLHFSSHRTLFNVEWLNGILVWFFCPFFGIPSGVYKVHHCIMHHIENNHGMDISATDIYQRDSWKNFGIYWLRFLFGIWIDLPVYCAKSKRYSHMRKLLSGISVYVVVIAVFAKFVNFTATLWVFMIPYVLAMTAMAFGNWSQHIFVNPDDCLSNYALTYNCIDAATNRTTFNDGYHVIHHLNARLHWTELPGYFHQTRDKHLAHGAITFRDIHFFDVGVLVMTRQLNKLAKHYVHLGSSETAPTLSEVEEKFRKWLRPIAPVEQAPKQVAHNEKKVS